jgi:hypothetical protein
MGEGCWNASSLKVPALEDGTAAYQVVGGVTDHQAYDGYGRWESEPGDGD